LTAIATTLGVTSCMG
ncbi:smalltalk protein, partial [Prevotella copri]|nr:smalltalk protein [Segatella copri]MQN14447.1 smalltalk protein [Segatella copri]MQO06674.1 smalltalk protein [Segatella copri]MQO06955.1 smalltalk protein [Segatella copri]MQP10182.1 smalltalk protein [Segatella copri]